MNRFFDRDGKPLPTDWYREKYPSTRFRSTEYRVASTVVGDVTVSTVWLALDHNHGVGAPIIFETMVFGEPYENEMRRYATEEQAMRGHLNVLDRLRTGRPPFDHLDDDDDDEGGDQ